jgi:hypothetical protein
MCGFCGGLRLRQYSVPIVPTYYWIDDTPVDAEPSCCKSTGKSSCECPPGDETGEQFIAPFVQPAVLIRLPRGRQGMSWLIPTI